MTEIKNFYFYSNQNFVKDIFSINAIACPSSSKKERAVSVGTINRDSLFITQKKLNRELRFQNLRPDLGDFPITVTISIPGEIDQDIELVEKDTYLIRSGKLSEYDSDKHLGVFWKSIIPLTFISALRFETKDDIVKLWDPSEVLWYPQEMCYPINDTEFSDVLDPNHLHDSALNYYQKSEDNQNLENEMESKQQEAPKPIIGAVTLYNKERAMAYHAISSTENWIVGKYKLNFDSYTLNILGISRDTAVAAIENKVNPQETKPEDLVIPLQGDPLTGTTNPEWMIIHETILNQLLNTDRTTSFNTEKFQEIAHAILTNIDATANPDFHAECTRNLNDIDGLLFHISGCIDDVLMRLKNAIPLTALLFVMKCPHPDDGLKNALETYNAGCIEARLASVYFAAINGFGGYPGEKKSDPRINLAVDRYVLDKLSRRDIHIAVANTESGYEAILPDTLSQKLKEPLPLTCERIITREDVHKLLTESTESAAAILSRLNGRQWLETLMNCYGTAVLAKLGIIRDEYQKFVFDTDHLPQELKYSTWNRLVNTETAGKELKAQVAELKQYLRTLIKPKFNEDEFISVHIQPAEMFKKLYGAKPEFWKELYVKYQKNSHSGC